VARVINRVASVFCCDHGKQGLFSTHETATQFADPMALIRFFVFRKKQPCGEHATVISSGHLAPIFGIEPRRL
jgi:hypothetical protein